MPDKNPSSARRGLLAAVLVGLAVVLGFGFIGCGRPPQMGADEVVFQSVDALFTAITAQDSSLLAQTEQRLHTLRDAGRLPLKASTYLDKVIGMAREGRWEPAAEKLYEFMLSQRREGARDRHDSREGSSERQAPGMGSGANARSFSLRASETIPCGGKLPACRLLPGKLEACPHENRPADFFWNSQLSDCRDTG